MIQQEGEKNEKNKEGEGEISARIIPNRWEDGRYCEKREKVNY